MPPTARKKSSKIKKEDAERQLKISSARERVLKIKRNIVAIIEAMLEKDISKQWFLDNCVKLCHADYNDVVEERNIEHMCGYPLCSNTVKQTLKQKYHISQVTNKVYDITERKCFCSNQCYKASNYLKTQLSPIPLYMRKEECLKILLLSDCDNRGSVGEELIFHHTIPQNEIEKVYSEEHTPNSLSKILEEEVKKCADSLSNLEVKERVYESQYVFGDETSGMKKEIEDESESDSVSDVDSDDSVDKKLFPSHVNMAVLSEKHMPIPEKSKKIVLIEPLKPSKATISPAQKLSLDFILGVFKDWITEDSMKYLLGEKYIYGVKADHLFEKMTAVDPVSSEKLESIKSEYINLCLKIDGLKDIDINDAYDFDMINEPENSSTVMFKKTVDVDNSTSNKVFKRKPSKKKEKTQKEKSKKVTFADDDSVSVKEKNTSCVNGVDDDSGQSKKLLEETQVTSPLTEPLCPLVDSVSQDALRKQILTSKFKSVYSDLLPNIGLHHTDIREGVRKFVDTLSLTPTNIVYKPKEMKLISLILLRILTKTVYKYLDNESQFSKLCQDPTIPIRTDIQEIDKIVQDIISPENVLNIQISNNSNLS